jgi:hypothetical protein
VSAAEHGPGDRRAARSWIRLVYLYLLSLIGLILITFGGIRLLDMGLKAFVFTQADREQRVAMMQPPMPYALERVQRIESAEAVSLEAEERALLRQWLEDYRQWRQLQSSVDPVVAQRQREASSSIAWILVGLPLYLYHWGLIRRDAPNTGAGADPGA